MSQTLRLFVALELPGEVRAALAAWADDAAPPEVRRVAVDNLHLTLAFLGSRSAQEADAVTALLDAVAAPVGELRTAGALWLPPRRPGVLTVALAGAPGLSALQAAVVAGLVDAVGFETESRSFRPHVTVGRVRRGPGVRASGLADPPQLAFEAQALTLFRSQIGPGGPKYEALARAALS